MYSVVFYFNPCLHAINRFFCTRSQLSCRYAWCRGITCAAPGPCSDTAEQCVLGLCTGATFLPVNSTCSDGNASTSFDVCRADHTCVGVDLCVVNNVSCPTNPNCASPSVCFRGECLPCTDLCANVQCANATQCMQAASCSRGVCLPAVPRSNGTTCDDGNDRTSGDVCNGQGTCAGIDLCAGVQCAPVACANVSCVHGQCSVTAFHPQGTQCDDGSAATVNDTCNAVGVCVGIDACAGVTCPTATQCREEVGQLAPPPLPPLPFSSSTSSSSSSSSCPPRENI